MKLHLNSVSKTPVSDVIIEENSASNLESYAAKYYKTVLIADAKVYRLWRKTLNDILPDETGILLVDGGDQNKNLKTYEKLLSQMLEAGCDRQTLVVSFGGGAISDLAGFVASSYMRGVAWVAAPTTLAAQTDAAIGGKTGVNLGHFKNMVGSFYPPLAVLIDPIFLKTLNRRELVSGLGEIIKMGYIHDKNILKLVDHIDPKDLLGDKLDQASVLSAAGKVDIVNMDLREAGERKILNFGHTVGHAVEAISLEGDNPLLHGEAVAIGMVAEAKLAELEGVCEPGLAESIIAQLNRFALPAQVSGADYSEIYEKLTADKKNRNSKILWTLPTGIGQGKFNHQAKPANIKYAIEFIT